MIEATPESLSRPPLVHWLALVASQITPTRLILPWTVSVRASVLRHHIWDAWILKRRDPRPITVITSDITDFVDSILVGWTLYSAERRGACRIKCMCQFDEIAEKRSHLRHDRRGAEKRLVAHAPGDD